MLNISQSILTTAWAESTNQSASFGNSGGAAGINSSGGGIYPKDNYCCPQICLLWNAGKKETTAEILDNINITDFKKS